MRQFSTKLLILLLVALSFVNNTQARFVSGFVKSGKQPIPEVAVTDGLHFTITDRQGNYSIDISPIAKFIYIVTPSGYIADYSSGIPQFYQKIMPEISKYNFQLKPINGKKNQTLMIGMADTQIANSHDCSRMRQETLPDIHQLIHNHNDYQVAAFIAGDITWDAYSLNDSIKSYAKQLSIPLYPVIGNHDYDKFMTGDESADYAHLYEDSFGPTYYAFWFGDACYVMLNNIKYKGHKKYECTLEQGNQMTWVRNLLTEVLQMNTRVIVVMHAPIFTWSCESLIPGGKQLSDLLISHRGEIFSGHYHTMRHLSIRNGLSEHNLGAVCGFWWSGNVSGDGTPNGYEVIESRDSIIHENYKSTGHDLDYQFRLYRPGQIADRPNDYVVEIWDWSSGWSAVWFEDGCFKGNLKQFYSYDPEYLSQIHGALTTGDYVPRRVNRFFAFHSSEDAHHVKLVVTDSNGKQYISDFDK
ncbi:MAG: calcineurin-like phosphoesterase C-terminal domain-containing protein [Prevotella sp.]|jgi:hypothetical protein